MTYSEWLKRHKDAGLFRGALVTAEGLPASHDIRGICIGQINAAAYKEWRKHRESSKG